MLWGVGKVLRAGRRAGGADEHPQRVSVPYAGSVSTNHSYIMAASSQCTRLQKEFCLGMNHSVFFRSPFWIEIAH